MKVQANLLGHSSYQLTMKCAGKEDGYDRYKKEDSELPQTIVNWRGQE